MENEFVAKDIREVAEKANERIKKELPVLEGLLDAMESSGMNIQLLSQVVHTIAVISPEQSYVFLDGVNAIYQELINQGKPDTINHDLWKSLKKSASVAKKLYDQETSEYQRQLTHFKSHYTKLAKDDPSINVEESIAFEEPYFQHVVCDISSAIKSFIFVMIMGYEPSEAQVQTLRNMMEKAKEIFVDTIEKKKQSINTTDYILLTKQ